MLNEFLISITNGCDGLIRKIEIHSFNSVIVTISALHISTNNWINIEFEINELSEFSIKQKKHINNTVLSRGIFYKQIEGMHFIDFSPYSESMDDVNDFRMSDIYFAAKNIMYKILPYSE